MATYDINGYPVDQRQSTTTPAAKPVATSTQNWANVQPAFLSSTPPVTGTTQAGTQAPIGSFPISKSVTPSAVTSSTAARTATTENYTSAADLANRRAYAENELARKNALATDAKAKADAEAAKIAATTKTDTTSRTDGFNATDAQGNRIYADPNTNTVGGIKFDNERYNPKPLEVEKEDVFAESMKKIDEDLKMYQDKLDYIGSGLDPAERSIVDAIKSSYVTRREETAKLNKTRLESMGTQGFRSGRARYASELQDSILGEEENAGLARIQKLDDQEKSATQAAIGAYRDKQYKTLGLLMKEVNNARNEKVDLLQKQFQRTRELEESAIKMAQEERAKFKMKMEVDAKIKEDAFEGFDKMAEAGVMPDEAAFDDLAEATGMDKATLVGLWKQQQEEKDMEQQKMELALSLDRAQIGATNALASQRMAGIVTPRVINAANAAGIPDDQIKKLTESNLSESAMLALIANYDGQDILTNVNEYGAGEKIVYNPATGGGSIPKSFDAGAWKKSSSSSSGDDEDLY